MEYSDILPALLGMLTVMIVPLKFKELKHAVFNIKQ